MNTESKMISFRADCKESVWLHVFNWGRISSTLHVLILVARICLDWNDFKKWKWMSEEELKKKKLVLIDKDPRACNTESQD